jgi:ATP-dependent Clp protease ATP-binding subunit ClpA
MSTRSFTQDEAMRELVIQTRKHLIGQEAAVTAFAGEICRHIAAGSEQPRPGIFLVAGPSIDGEHLGLPSGLAACFKSGGGLYELAVSNGEDLAHIFAPIVGGKEVRSLLRSARDNPNAVFVLQDIDKARPNLVNAWSQGFIEDEGGEEISLAEAIFVLTTEVAQELIGQIARDEADPDRLHVQCLNALLDAGLPASLLKSIDTVVALKTPSPGEAVLEHYRSFAEQVASHGLVLKEGGIDGRVLAHSIDTSIETDIADVWLPRDKLDARLAEAKAAGIHTVRLVLGEGIITIVPVGEPSAHVDAIPPADAVLLSSPEGETAGE